MNTALTICLSAISVYFIVKAFVTWNTYMAFKEDREQMRKTWENFSDTIFKVKKGAKNATSTRSSRGKSTHEK